MCQSFTNRKCGWNNLWVSTHEKFEHGKKVYRALQLERMVRRFQSRYIRGGCWLLIKHWVQGIILVVRTNFTGFNPSTPITPHMAMVQMLMSCWTAGSRFWCTLMFFAPSMVLHRCWFIQKYPKTSPISQKYPKNIHPNKFISQKSHSSFLAIPTPPRRHSHEGHPGCGADDQQGATGGGTVGDQVPQGVLRPGDDGIDSFRFGKWVYYPS